MAGIIYFLFMLVFLGALVSRLRGQQHSRGGSADRSNHNPAPGRPSRPWGGTVGDDEWGARPEQVNSAGDADWRERAARRVNPVGDGARLDRAEQRRNAVGDSVPRSRPQRMVEEQRARAEAYRRQQSRRPGAEADSARTAASAKRSGSPAPVPEQGGRSHRDCPACGRLLRPGQTVCPYCGAAVMAAPPEPAAVPEERPLTKAPEQPSRPVPAAFSLPGFSGPELTRALVMAEVLGPCKARSRSRR